MEVSWTKVESWLAPSFGLKTIFRPGAAALMSVAAGENWLRQTDSWPAVALENPQQFISQPSRT